MDSPFGGTDNNGPVDVLKGTDTNVYKIYEAGVGTGGSTGNIPRRTFRR